MKVAICIKYINGNPRFSESFGNSDEFLVYDVEREKLHDKLTNHFKYSPTAEIFCAQVLIKRGINSIVCWKCGIDAKNLFSEADIEVIENIEMRPTEFVNILFAKYKSNKSIAM